MFDVDDLKDQAPKKTKRGQHLVRCDAELWDLLQRFKRRHGKEKTAEVVRRSMKAGLLFADKELKPGS